MNRMTALFAAAPLALAGMLTATSASAQGTCAGGFVVVPSPNVSTINDNDLSSVAGRAPDDVWAVGQYAPDSDPNITLTLAEHFNGTAWSIVPTPNVGTQGNALLRVATLGNGTAWAVGYRIDDQTFWARSLIEFWDGKAWQVVDHPQLGDSAQLFGVAVRAPDDVWAVGTYQHPLAALHTLIEHFDGKTWHVVPSPNPGATGNQLYAVTAVAKDRAWAVGTSAGTASPSPALLLAWDGKHWTIAPTPTSDAANLGLYGMTVDPSGHLFAVGEAEDDTPGLGTVGLAETSATGAHWTREPVTRSGTGDNHFYDVTAPGGGAAWAVGGSFDVKTGNVRTLIAARDPVHGGWTPVASPTPNPGDDNILGGVAVIGKDVWAVGVAPNQNARQTLIVHYCPGGR